MTNPGRNTLTEQIADHAGHSGRTADWIRAVEMIAAQQGRSVTGEHTPKLPENFSTDDIDVVQVRSLSTQI